MSTYRYEASVEFDAAMASIDMVWEYWESGQYNYEVDDVYPCGCCACCGCSCVPDTLEAEAYVVGPSLDGSTRGTTAFAVRRRK